MGLTYRSGFINWTKPCIFTCSIHGDFDHASPAKVFNDERVCPRCKLKNMSEITSRNCDTKVFGVGTFDLDMNIFEDVQRYKKVKCLWKGVLERCFVRRKNYKTYYDCTISEDWLSCYNFFEDIRNMGNYEMIFQGWHLDKDILKQGNKHYSKDNCCIVPPDMNTLITRTNKKDGRLPVGVRPTGHEENPYYATCRLNGKIKNLGRFKTKQSAYEAYKTAKRGELLRVSNKYKELIPEDVFKAFNSLEFNGYMGNLEGI